ncbi:MAG: RHS repeat-associated core domain-containing protein, partial [Actinobacteria bacterium]|nr:RHS repeat-associated core domain-containing protein [Actinomycetota bacterium]
FTPSTHLEARFLLHDGHGSVRQLTDSTGTITDTYDFDAFGNLITHTGTTPNNYLFAGEQFDPDLNLYYNRARYLDVRTGRFWTMDIYEGFDQRPDSLHKYLYTSADPANNADPTGRILANVIYGQIVHRRIGEHFTLQSPLTRFSDRRINTILGAIVPGGTLRPDLADSATREVYEIKSILLAPTGYPQLAGYLYVLNTFDPLRRVWIPGISYVPPARIDLDALTYAVVSPPVGGVIIYSVVNFVELFGLVALAIKTAVPRLQLEFGLATVNSTLAGGAI